jgi:endonuclease III-like uncharacterized protein
VTPSYCAYFLYTTYDELNEKLYEMSDIEFDELEDAIRCTDNYTDKVSYFHVRSVTEFAHDFGKESHDEDDYKTVLDNVLEYCNANWLV